MTSHDHRIPVTIHTTYATNDIIDDLELGDCPTFVIERLDECEFLSWRFVTWEEAKAWLSTRQDTYRLVPFDEAYKINNRTWQRVWQEPKPEPKPETYCTQTFEGVKWRLVGERIDHTTGKWIPWQGYQADSYQAAKSDQEGRATRADFRNLRIVFWPVGPEPIEYEPEMGDPTKINSADYFVYDFIITKEDQ
jgi:hypothetical protein